MSTEVRDRIQNIFSKSDGLQLATTGTSYSPWIAGVYFAEELTDKSADLYFLAEQSGKTFGNLRQDPRVAISISKNDAKEDFVQARGIAEVLPAEEEARIRQMLVNKMPWYQTYTPCVPVRIRLEEVFVSSLASGWFPAKQLAFETEQ